jgi:hypothetical protein
LKLEVVLDVPLRVEPLKSSNMPIKREPKEDRTVENKKTLNTLKSTTKGKVGVTNLLVGRTIIKSEMNQTLKAAIKKSKEHFFFRDIFFFSLLSALCSDYDCYRSCLVCADGLGSGG